MKSIIILIAVLLFVSCKREKVTDFGDDSIFMDTVSANRYYDKEIFPDEYSGIYSKWKLTEVFGGIAGIKHENNFDYLILKPHGIYCIMRNDSLVEFGKVNVYEESDEGLRVEFEHDKLSRTVFYDSEKYANLKHKDTLILQASCCDRYDYTFVREK